MIVHVIATPAPGVAETVDQVMAGRPGCLFIDVRPMARRQHVDGRLRRGSLVRQYGERYHHLGTLLGIGASAQQQVRGLAALAGYLSAGHDLLLFSPSEPHGQRILQALLPGGYLVGATNQEVCAAS